MNLKVLTHLGPPPTFNAHIGILIFFLNTEN